MGSYASTIKNKATSLMKDEKEKAPPTSDKEPTTPQAFKYYANAQKEFKGPEIANGNAFLGDIFSSTSSTPISSGLFHLLPGPPLDYTYTYHEMKMVVDGSFDISDSTGQTVHATKGDVLYFPKGSKIRFEANGEDNGGKGGLGFYVGQRAEGTA